MKNIFLILLLFIFSTITEAIGFKILCKCKFELSDGSTKQGWFWMRDNQVSMDMDVFLPELNNYENDITVYKRIFIPKYAKTFLPDSSNGYLENRFLCTLENEVFQLKPSTIKKIRIIDKIEGIELTWQRVTLVSKKLLKMLQSHKRFIEYTYNNELNSYSFFSYNPKIPMKKLIKLAAIYFEKVSSNRITEQEVEKLNQKYQKLNIIVVYAYGPC